MNMVNRGVITATDITPPLCSESRAQLQVVQLGGRGRLLPPVCGHWWSVFHADDWW